MCSVYGKFNINKQKLKIFEAVRILNHHFLYQSQLLNEHCSEIEFNKKVQIKTTLI